MDSVILSRTASGAKDLAFAIAEIMGDLSQAQFKVNTGYNRGDVYHLGGATYG
jgi:hypothetical protein